ncbi:MAG: hypothetical protein MUF59_07005 [Candidatus Krumholzibacteria bacterium]|jgi:hypothetical protein|nr:hypothetical protein [Candidatus Krumholzibacteria bacterium]
MSYTIMQFDEGKYIELFYYGEFTISELDNSKIDANEILSRNGWRRVLVDVTTAHAYPATVDYFDFASGLTEDAPGNIRLALIVREERKEIGRFFENVAVNRGLDVRCFTGREDAMSWLLDAGGPDGD